MKLITNPEVYIVGRQHLDPTELYRFFENEEISWLPEETCADAEIIPEIAGRLCYMSFNKPRPGGNEKYLHHIIEVGHGSVLEATVFSFILTGISRSLCYSPDTEVFTEDGWKNITLLKQEDIILTKNPVSGLARWSSILKMNELDYTGSLLGWSTSQMSSPLMTPDHLLWAAKYDLRRARGLSAEQNIREYGSKIAFSEIFGKRFHIDAGIQQDGEEYTTVDIGGNTYDAEYLFSWLGWMATDGCLSKSRPNKVNIDQSKKENIPIISSLMSKLFKDNWHVNGPYSTENMRFHTSVGGIAEFVREHLGPNKKERKFSKWLLNASNRLLKIFLDSAIAGDGCIHKTNGHTVLYCPSNVAAGQYQYILARLGTPGNIRVDNRIGESHILYGKECVRNIEMYNIEIDRRGPGKLIKAEHQYSVPYVGKVYCPTTEDGLIFVRGSGQPFWCGNSHELIRHRAGVAISQLSQRYVDESVAEYVVPPEYVLAVQTYNSGNTSDSLLYNMGEEWLSALQNAHKAYCRMVDLTTKKLQAEGLQSTDLRKHARQAARSLLPNATETKIFWTANVRTLRHFLEQRGNISADKEIQNLALKLLQVCKKEAPNLFKDYEITEKGIDTQFRKV